MLTHNLPESYEIDREVTREHKFVALSQRSIDTDTITVVVVCRACGVRGLISSLAGEDCDDGLVETIGARLVEHAEAAVLEHAAEALAARPGASQTSPQEIAKE